MHKGNIMNKGNFKEKKNLIEEEVREELHREKAEVKEAIKHTKRSKVILSLLKLLLLFTIVIAVPVYIVFCHRDFITSFDSIEDVVSFLENYKTESILVYIAMQAVQIIISVIPGQAFQFAAGILWGFFLGLLFSLIGAFVGTTISFYLAKLLGRDAMHLLFTEEKMNWFVEKLNSRKAYTIVFLIYLIPGLPKDIMSYAAGISSMNFKAFLIFSMIGRTPAMSGSLLIGALYFSGHYGIMIAIGVFALAAFVLCIVFRKKISNYIDKLYEKVTED